MKNIKNIAIILLLGFQYLHSQDIILLKNGKSLKTKVLMVKNELIYYRPFNASQHNIKTIKLKKIQNIYLSRQYKKFKEIIAEKDSTENKPVVQTNVENKDTTITPVQKHHVHKKIKIFQAGKVHKKSLGIGTDIFFTDKNKKFTGLSIDLYIHRYFNAAFGYGYLQGNLNPYATGTIIFPLKNDNWSIITAYQFMRLNKNTIEDLEIFDKDTKINKAAYNIFSIGMEYRDDTGLSTKFWIGTAITSTSGINKHSGILMGFRIAGHI